jgi:hypothetical protein
MSPRLGMAGTKNSTAHPFAQFSTRVQMHLRTLVDLRIHLRTLVFQRIHLRTLVCQRIYLRSLVPKRKCI